HVYFKLAPRAPGEVSAEESGGTASELTEVEKVETSPLTPWKIAVLAAFFGFFGWLFIEYAFQHPIESVADKGPLLKLLMVFALLAVPFLLSFFALYAALRGVKVYEQFVDGAREAFNTATRIIPFLVAMLVSIRLLRDAGVVDAVTDKLSPFLSVIKFPAELLPM